MRDTSSTLLPVLRRLAPALACAVALGTVGCSPGQRAGVDFSDVDITPCPDQAALERELAGVTARLRVALPGRYAGRRISCNPLKVVVLLKGDTRYQTRTMQWPRGEVTVEFVSGSRYATEDLNAAVASGLLAARFPGAHGIGTDAVNGRILVDAADDAAYARYQAAAAELEKELGVPIAIKRGKGDWRL
ncbi:hypothetical protein [Stenotrophomonas sp. YAU14D1_LEIMI4_1]|uniref:hypothetical protein n=1 Tax=Stenotrophomonas sp. YAU14D1_LEIMI4_1 TaxID=2072407 RepID=UPI00131F1815|nr:hypothetical protein [Stenotrophomonas sp. YAU14D1_LEIMI4_1]